MNGHWNRAARRSGGDRKAKIPVAPLDADDLRLLAQEAAIRREFGEEGVRRFWELVEKNARSPPPAAG